MRKRFVTAVLLLVCMAFLVTGCSLSSKSKKDKDEEETEEATEEEVTEIAITTDEVEEEVVEEPETEAYDFSVEEEVQEEVVEEETPQVEVDEFGVASIDEKTMYATEAVRIRREPNTDSEVAGKLAAGEEVTVNGQGDEWHRIKKGEDNLYVKSEYLTDTKPETKAENTEDNATGDTNTETKKTDDQKAAEAALKAAQEATAAAAAASQTTNNDQKSAADQAAQQATTQDAAAIASQSPAAAAAVQSTAAAVGGGTTVNCTDGSMVVNSRQLEVINKYWGYTGDAVGFAGHHSKGQLQELFAAEGVN